jgi:VacB/RNase II family 3'-5' exoribonuclease
MSSLNGRSPRLVLQEIARRVMVERGLAPEFLPDAQHELSAINGAAPIQGARALRSLLWCSIDNDDSRDLDQLTVAEALSGGAIKVCIAIADVTAVVRQNSAIDQHARQNTTSVYTAAQIFPMLPERLSTDLTSLNFQCDRRAVVTEIVFSASGGIQSSDIYEAVVFNRAKLAYNSVAAWLEGTGPMPAPIDAVPGLADNLRLQDRVAQTLRASRHERGALSLETIQARPVFDGGALTELAPERSNRAKQLIEDLMIAANGVNAKFLGAKRFPSVRRIVRTPKNWDRIVALAAEHAVVLPTSPNAPALEEFLVAAQEKDPLRFPDLSLSIVKLIGAGEYVVELPGESAPGHFGLAVKDYAHSTAPNRRFPDVITQRLVKAALAGTRPPYTNDELVGLAEHCTEQEDAAKKVERQVGKSAAAILLSPRIGQQFDAVVTGAADKGTWVRILHPPVEGKLVNDTGPVAVGQRFAVRLVHVDVNRGYIDFTRAR